MVQDSSAEERGRATWNYLARIAVQSKGFPRRRQIFGKP
jgi:hypothetical protein